MFNMSTRTPSAASWQPTCACSAWLACNEKMEPILFQLGLSAAGRPMASRLRLVTSFAHRVSSVSTPPLSELNDLFVFPSSFTWEDKVASAPTSSDPTAALEAVTTKWAPFIVLRAWPAGASLMLFYPLPLAFTAIKIQSYVGMAH